MCGCQDMPFFLPHFVLKNKNQARNCCPAPSKWPFAPVSFLKVLNFLQWLGTCLENIFLIGSSSPQKLRESKIRCRGWETPETFQFPEEIRWRGGALRCRSRQRFSEAALQGSHLCFVLPPGFRSWSLSTPTPKPQESNSGQKS